VDPHTNKATLILKGKNGHQTADTAVFVERVMHDIDWGASKGGKGGKDVDRDALYMEVFF